MDWSDWLHGTPPIPRAARPWSAEAQNGNTEGQLIRDHSRCIPASTHEEASRKAAFWQRIKQGIVPEQWKNPVGIRFDWS